MFYIARFKHAKGRYLVEKESYGYGGQRIADARQLKYGNPPDRETGLFLYESYRWFGPDEVVSIKPFTKK